MNKTDISSPYRDQANPGKPRFMGRRHLNIGDRPDVWGKLREETPFDDTPRLFGSESVDEVNSAPVALGTVGDESAVE